MSASNWLTACRFAISEKVREAVICLCVAVAGGLGAGFVGSVLRPPAPPPLLGDLLGGSLIPQDGPAHLAGAIRWKIQQPKGDWIPTVTDARTQNPLPARACGFKSHLRHSEKHPPSRSGNM